jgi:hypothetical protein
VHIAREPAWPGYFGSPGAATAAQGARINRAATDAAIACALKILDGMDPREIARFAEAAGDSPENVAIDADALRREMDMQRKQEEWLTRMQPR